MIFQKVTFVEEGRNASSVDDFYYRGYEEKLKGKKGTGVRRVAADMIRDGKSLFSVGMQTSNLLLFICGR